MSPDKHHFDHLPDHGLITVRCTEEGCSAGGPLYQWSERARARHAKSHEREKERLTQKKREEALKEARRLKKQRERENRKAYGE